LDPTFGDAASRYRSDAMGQSASPWWLGPLERAAVGFYRVRLQPHFRVEEVSYGVERLTGYTSDELASEPELLRRMVHPEDRRRLDLLLSDPSELAAHSRIRLVHRDGGVVHTEHVAFVTRDELGAPARVEGIVRDVTAVHGAPGRSAIAGDLQDLPSAIYLAEPSGFVALTSSIEDITGFSADEWVRQPTLWAERLHPDDRARVLFLSTAGAVGHAWQAEYRWLARDGRVVRIRQTSAPIRNGGGDVICLQGMLLPESAWEASTGASPDAERMDAMAKLAGVVAHDLNNLLTVVLGHSEMLLDMLSESGRTRESALEIRNAGETAARITHQLLALSGHQALAPKTVDLNELILDAADALHQLAGSMELRFDLASSLPPVDVDTRQMERVLRNLVMDARDATPVGGRLTLATRPRHGSEREVVLTAADARPLLPDDALAAIFEPTLSGRKSPRGSGLNRAAVHGIVQQHRGRISVDQSSMGGLTFTIVLPAAKS
jgi:PAS domain S-box-containing protein